MKINPLSDHSSPSNRSLTRRPLPALPAADGVRVTLSASHNLNEPTVAWPTTLRPGSCMTVLITADGGVCHTYKYIYVHIHIYSMQARVTCCQRTSVYLSACLRKCVCVYVCAWQTSIYAAATLWHTSRHSYFMLLDSKDFTLHTPTPSFNGSGTTNAWKTMNNRVSNANKTLWHWFTCVCIF